MQSVDECVAPAAHQLVDGVNLLVGAVVPAEVAQVVDHGLGQEALELELVDLRMDGHVGVRMPPT